METLTNNQRLNLTRARVAIEEQLERQKLQNIVNATQTSLGIISSLTSSSNRSLFALGKAASLVSAIINNAQAITKTMAATPFPFNIALAAAQAAAGIIQIQKIRSQRPPQLTGEAGQQVSTNVGMQSGGVVDQVTPGNTPPGEDGIIGARLGEGLLNVEATARLGRDAIDAINAGGNVAPVFNITVVSQNGGEVVNVVNDYLKEYGTSEQGVSL